MRTFVLKTVIIVLGAFSPLIISIGSSFIGSVAGCTVNESKPHPCLIAGIDIGPLLADAFVLGWLSLVTIPAGAALLLGHFWSGIIFWFSQRYSLPRRR